MLDVALVPSNEQVKIAVCNFRIALEKSQPNVIYKVCLEILKQYSFYNVVIATTDAPEIYMQQFGYTITYDLTAQAYFFTMGDQEFKVNVDVLRNALSTTLKVLDHSFTLLAPEKEIIKFINELRWKDTAYVSPRLPVLQLLCGMYSEYMEKSKGSAPIKATRRGKGLLTKQGVEIAVERVSTPKRGWSKTVIEEVAQSEQVVDDYSEGSGITLEVPDKLVFKSSTDGAGVTLKVSDKLSNSSSRSSSDSEFIVKDISSDEAKDSEKTDC
ncbi:hypothetical protein Tco_0432996 [Tanacetum coccineum]